MQRIENQAVASSAERDYGIVKSYFAKLRAPHYDKDSGKSISSTPIIDITEKLIPYLSDRGRESNSNRFFLKEEYKNQLTESIKGRAVAAMVLNAIESGSIYSSSGMRKRWIEPTSGNTGKGLAAIAKLLGIEFTAVLSRLDVSPEIKNNLIRSGAKIITIGSEYSVNDLEAIASQQKKPVHYYWSMVAGIDANSKSILSKAVNSARKLADIRDVEVKQVEGGMLIDPLLPLAVQASKSPIIDQVQRGEYLELKDRLQKKIPELQAGNDNIVAFLCSHGNSSMALNALFSQLGFGNVCSIKGGMDALNIQAKNGGGEGQSEEFCPIPGTSIARSSIEFVKKVVNDNPDRYFTFMQYENIENTRAHEQTTGPELEEQIEGISSVACTFGTGGTATGLAQFFAPKGVKVLAAFPEKPVEGIRTMNGAEGLAFFKPELYSEIIQVNNSDAMELLNYLLRNNINVGPSTAIALKAAIEASANETGKKYAVIAADGIENYTSHYYRQVEN